MVCLPKSLLAPIVAISIGFCSTSAFALDKVKLRLDWVFGAEHAPIFLAMEKGFFKDAGIDVTVLPGEGSSV
ncbi:MAG: ABC transporter substrate-binding protein, partial [Rhizobiales bacterium]|nr:ABC transporter substrate-binding protein [Hyphomicrobiales bacterium]